MSRSGSHHAAHAHTHAGPPPPFLRGRRALLGLAGLVVLAVLVGLALLRPEGTEPAPSFDQGARTSGSVLAVVSAPCVESGSTSEPRPADAACIEVTVRVDDGPDAGFELVQLSDRRTLPGLTPGRGVVLLRGDSDVPLDQRYQLLDVERGRPLVALGLLFAVAVLVVGRLRGVLALAGLASSLIILGGWLVPALLSGRPPVPTAVVGATAVMVVVLGLAHGPGLRTATALLGTVLGLLVTVTAATVAVDLAGLSGLASDEAAYVQVAFPALDLRGLLLAGIVIGSLGVLDDVTVTQVSTVWELRRADPRQSRRSLYASAMRVGRDHIAATTNTLLLAYVGASLPVLVLFSTSGETLVQGLTTSLVAEEVVRTLAGSIGLVSAVPLTTALAALCCPPGADDPQQGRSQE